MSLNTNKGVAAAIATLLVILLCYIYSFTPSEYSNCPSCDETKQKGLLAKLFAKQLTPEQIKSILEKNFDVEAPAAPPAAPVAPPAAPVAPPAAPVAPPAAPAAKPVETSVVETPAKTEQEFKVCPFKPPPVGIDNGAWNYTAQLIASSHVKFDEGFGLALVNYLGVATVADIGAGVGQLGFFLSTHEADITWDGYDGGYNIQELRGQHTPLKGFKPYYIPDVCWIDASKPFTLPKRHDWVLSVEVGEHIPKSGESIFMDNLVNNCDTGVILTWAVVGQGGYKHINCQNNDYVINEMEKRNMVYDLKQSTLFRASVSDLGWLRNTIMVFKKQ